MIKPLLFIYGPPGSGKTTIGRLLSEQLNLPFYDLDHEIEKSSGKSIPELFTSIGEVGFRQLESALLKEAASRECGIVALGGGALLNQENCQLAKKNGQIVCLTAPCEVLAQRLFKDNDQRPLLKSKSFLDLSSRLNELITQRASHYESFGKAFDTSKKSPDQIAWDIQVYLGIYHIRGMGKGYDVWVLPYALEQVGQALQQRKMHGPIALITDEQVGNLYAEKVCKAVQQVGYCVHLITIPTGEQYKTLSTLSHLWEALLACGFERRSTVIAMGGGVVGDLVGFAAATLMRGVKWVVLPTSLLAMVDASLGGKTGIDLPQGKNLVGAFYPPSLVWVDPNVLETLPWDERRNGMAEVVKAGVIADQELFQYCSEGWQAIQSDWKSIVTRAMAVKIRLIQEDPYEQGQRAVLNFGHTIGHALETLSNYRLRHGEAVAVGMVVETWLAEQIGLAETGLTNIIQQTLRNLGLPTEMPSHIRSNDLMQVMSYDKKRSGGRIRFALPRRIGEVVYNVEIPNLETLLEVKP